ncbi:hypothetical protein Tco_0539564 [Tanacetum coccineum]
MESKGNTGVAISDLLGAIKAQEKMIYFPMQNIIVAPGGRKTIDIKRRGLREGASLLEVVKEVKLDVLLELFAVDGMFSKELTRMMKKRFMKAFINGHPPEIAKDLKGCYVDAKNVKCLAE